MILFLHVGLAGFTFAVGSHRRSRREVQEWADGNGYFLMDVTQDPWGGPFFLVASNGTVYKVTVLICDEVRQGWVFSPYILWRKVCRSRFQMRWSE